jgi:hypothetical protein
MANAQLSGQIEHSEICSDAVACYESLTIS